MQHELEELFAWLEAGEQADYQTGVLVLQQHCKNRSLVNGLLKKESPSNREKLVYELVKIGCDGRMEDVNEVLNHFAQAVQGAVPLVQPVADVPQGQDVLERPELEQIPENQRWQYDVLTQLMGQAYNQRCQLSNSLPGLDPAEGPRVVKEILALEQHYNTLAEKRRKLEAGEPIEPEQPAPATEPTAPEQPAPATEPTALEQPAPATEPTAPEQPAAPTEPGSAETPAPSAEPAAASTPTPGIDRAELVKQRGNLRSNISKANKSAAEAKTEAKRSHYAQKAGKLQVELDLVEMQLAQPQV